MTEHMNSLNHLENNTKTKFQAKVKEQIFVRKKLKIL